MNAPAKPLLLFAIALGALLLAATLVLYSVYRRFGKAELSLG